MVHYGIVFYSLLNIAGLISLIILKENVSEARMKRTRFLQTLAKDLCREQIMSKINLKNIPSWAKNCPLDFFGVKNQARPPTAGQVISGRCYLCDF